MFSVKRLTGAGASALALALLSTPGWAAVTAASSTVPTYATQSVPASGAVTMPTTLAAAWNATFTAAGCPAAATVTVQFTLPSAVTFTTTPTAVITGPGITAVALATAVSGGAPTGNVSFTATCAAFAGVGAITLNQFSVTGATTLATPLSTSATGASTGFAISATVTAITGAVTDVAVGNKTNTGLANAANGLSYFVTGGPAAGAAVIDSASPSLARQFQQPLGSADTVVADIGNIAPFITGGLINASGLAFTFGGVPANISVTGNFLGISKAYLQAGGTTTCGTTSAIPATAIPGVVTSSGITFTPDPFTGAPAPQEVCLIADGTKLISASGAITTSATVGSTTVIAAGTLVGYTFSGSPPFQILYTGKFGSFTGFVRIVNNNTSPVNVFAIIQTDAGVLGTANVETGLVANNNDTIAVPTILTASGVTLPASGRVTITLVASQANVLFSHMIFNPNGTLTAIP